MSEAKADTKELLAEIRTDVLESIGLYFAPVKAVAREFQVAVERGGDERDVVGSDYSKKQSLRK
jgi:hypothetical protein